MVKLRQARMWVMATSPKNYIALFSFQRPGQGVKPDSCKQTLELGLWKNS